MKTKLIFLLFSLSGIMNVSSCKEDNFDKMPPETQSGKNTFGCMIDGELFVGGCCAPWMTAPLTVTYSKVSNKLSIEVWGKMNGNSAGSIGMLIDSLQQSSTQNFSLANYFPHGLGECPNYSTSNDGMCIITKLDTLNKIVSGRFEFVGRCADWNFNIMDSTATKKITQGRFDLKLNVINE